MGKMITFESVLKQIKVLFLLVLTSLVPVACNGHEEPDICDDLKMSFRDFPSIDCSPRHSHSALFLHLRFWDCHTNGIRMRPLTRALPHRRGPHLKANSTAARRMGLIQI